MDRIDLFSGISSLGMPNTVDNKDNYGYVDYVRDYLINKGYNVSTYNISSLDRNYTWDLEKVFKCNYSMSQIRKIQISSIDNLRNTNFLFKLVVPKKYQKKLKLMNNDEKIGDVYKKAIKPIFLYSTGINDMFVFMHAGPVELLNKTIRTNMANEFQSFFIQAINNIRNNLIFLTEMNHEVDIYVLSVYYSNIVKLIDKIINLQNVRDKNNILPKDLIYYIQAEFNRRLFDLCNEFSNVHLIDLYSEKLPCAKFDFHPSREGNIIIGNKVIEELENNYFNGSKLQLKLKDM